MARASIPTALKLENGNPNRQTLPWDEPRPVLIGDIAPPTDLLFSEMAVKVWEMLAKDMKTAKMLAETDKLAMCAMCNTAAEYFAIEKEIAGLVHAGKWDQMGGGRGKAFSNRVTIRNDAEARFRSNATQFGLTPAARTKLTQINTQIELPFDVPVEESEDELLKTIQQSASRLEEMGVVLPFERKA